MKTETRVIIILSILVIMYGGVGVYMAVKADNLAIDNATLATDLEAHALSVWGLEDALGIKQQALDDVIGDLNDCIKAQEAGEQWMPQRSHTEYGVPNK